MYSNYAAPLGVALSATLATSPLGTADPAGKDLPAYRAPEDPAAHDLDPPAEPTGRFTLPQALTLALTCNPELATFSQETRAREAAALQAGLLPNPALNISAENFANSRLEGFDGPARRSGRRRSRPSRIICRPSKRSPRPALTALGRAEAPCPGVPSGAPGDLCPPLANPL